ncbi:MAG: acyl-CoA dehydrogenase family protein [Pseudomonadota bacterium]|jgi:butyryl-CoA dehydrogenase|nr:acyl-CoA dehydrogenase family protein [Gammaproteobacteria bacterium]MDC2994646.1 acyl-CoA dehydrogenase family protein [Gammaproteobacteria bacterium]MEC9226804.1 acyl-CoA dehydrogenase family protein [Pseudomonadota bacterium]GIS23467.1 MAG: acyl-CoA dehydrogenase [Gammaproteobacteria bacterium]
MDFKLTAEQLELQKVARDFAQKELTALADEMEESANPVPKDVLKKIGELGFLGINTPTEYGGLGLSNLDAIIVLEEFGKISSAVGWPVFEANAGPVKVIEHFGSDALKKRVIPKVCKGEMVVAVSMSEPNAGTGLTDLKTKAEIKGDKIVINGTKRWCSGAGHSDGYVVYARMSDAPAAKGIGAVFVDIDTPGLTFGNSESLMGWRGIPSADIYFDNVEVPIDNLLVEPEDGFKKLMETFDLERCGNATMALSQAAAALDYVKEYVQEREQFGKQLVDFQAVQIKLADMLIRVEASRLLIHRAVFNAANGLPDILESSTAKCFANEIAREVTTNAMQLMGGYGFNKEYKMERRVRDSFGWGIAGGTIDVQKVNIASAMIGRRFNQRAK